MYMYHIIELICQLFVSLISVRIYSVVGGKIMEKRIIVNERLMGNRENTLGKLDKIGIGDVIHSANVKDMTFYIDHSGSSPTPGICIFWDPLCVGNPTDSITLLPHFISQSGNWLCKSTFYC